MTTSIKGFKYISMKLFSWFQYKKYYTFLKNNKFLWYILTFYTYILIYEKSIMPEVMVKGDKTANIVKGGIVLISTYIDLLNLICMCAQLILTYYIYKHSKTQSWQSLSHKSHDSKDISNLEKLLEIDLSAQVFFFCTFKFMPLHWALFFIF